MHTYLLDPITICSIGSSKSPDQEDIFAYDPEPCVPGGAGPSGDDDDDYGYKEYNSNENDDYDDSEDEYDEEDDEY